MKKFLLAISGVLLALGALIAPANAQQGQALIVSSCGSQTLTAATYGYLTMDTTGKLCDSSSGGGGGGGAVFGPTAAGSAAANPPVIVGGTADGTATGNVVNWKVLAGIGYINCANCSGSGVSSVDEATFTAGTSLFAGTGGFFQTTATSNALTNGQQGMFQVTANRALFSNLRNAAGAEVGVAAVPLQVSLANTAANAAAVLVTGTAGTFPVTQSTSPWIAAGGGTAGTAATGVVTVQGIASMTKLLVTPDSVALPANQSVNVAQINGVTPLMGNGVTGTGSPRVTIASDNTAFSVNATLSAETTKVIGTTRLTGNVGGVLDAIGQNVTAPANWLQAGCQFNTTPTTISSGSGSPCQVDNAGNLLVNVKTATGLADGSTSSGQTFSKVGGNVTTAAPTYTTAQTNPLSLTTAGALRHDITSVNSVAILTGTGAVGTGAQRVAVATDTATIAGSAPGTAGTASTNVVTVQGVASMTKLLVTPDSVALPANQSVNTAQVNGVTTLTGTGATGTGAQRVTVAVDSATNAGSAPVVGSGTQATAPRTTLATDSPGIITLGGATPANSVPTVSAGFTFGNMTTATTTTFKSGAGVLHTITIGTLGTVASAVSIFDNTAGSGTSIGILNSLTTGQGTYTFDVAFTTGLTITTTGTVAPNITVSYR